MSADINVKYSETQNQIQLQFQKPTLRYLDEFIKLKCAPDLLALKVFPNAKEITESMGAYNVMRKYLLHLKEYELGNDNICCLMIGDGCTPRTGALFAFRTNWQIYSIDPRLRVTGKPTILNGWKLLTISRLTICPVKAEDFRFQLPVYKKIIIVAVHSHASLKKTVKNIKQQFKGTIDIISIPCCVSDDLDRQPDVSYLDWGIHSEKRRINIYKGV